MSVQINNGTIIYLHWHTWTKVVPNHNQPTNQPKQQEIAWERNGFLSIFCLRKKWIFVPKSKFEAWNSKKNLFQLWNFKRFDDHGSCSGSIGKKQEDPRSRTRSREQKRARVHMYNRRLKSETSDVSDFRLRLYQTPKTCHFEDDPCCHLKMAMYPYERDYVKSLFENLGRALTSKCLKNDKNPHDCNCQKRIYMYKCLHIHINIHTHVYLLQMKQQIKIYVRIHMYSSKPDLSEYVNLRLDLCLDHEYIKK